MTKPFTELPAPIRTHRLSIVAVWNPIDVYCEHAKCKWPDFVEEIFECPICGRHMCDECFGEEGVNIPGAHDGMYAAPCCDDCSKLTADERQAMMERARSWEVRCE